MSDPVWCHGQFPFFFFLGGGGEGKCIMHCKTIFAFIARCSPSKSAPEISNDTLYLSDNHLCQKSSHSHVRREQPCVLGHATNM